MSHRRSLSLATAVAMGVSAITLSVAAGPASAADCSTTFYSKVNLGGSSATLTPQSQDQTLPFTAVSATTTTGCPAVYYKDSQNANVASFPAGGGTILSFDPAIKMGLNWNHNETLL